MSTATTTTTIESLFAPYTRLSPSIYLIPPRITPTSSSSTTISPTTASTIILAFWYSAPPRALIKYVVQYAQLAPSSRIIFILSGPKDFYFYPTLASHRRRLKPVIDLLLRQEQQQQKQEPVYIHLFSNGGMFTITHLLLAYKHATGGMPLKVSSMVLDSAPGKSTPGRSIKALAYALPQTLVIRQVGLGLLSVLVWVGWAVRKLIMLKKDDAFAFTRRITLDSDFIVAKEGEEEEQGEGEGGNSKKGVIRSCYLYSDTDDLVPWQDVEEHAAMAVTKGRVVQLEKFRGTPHVGHMRSDPERYWGIVKQYLVS